MIDTCRSQNRRIGGDSGRQFESIERKRAIEEEKDGIFNFVIGEKREGFMNRAGVLEIGVWT